MSSNLTVPTIFETKGFARLNKPISVLDGGLVSASFWSGAGLILAFVDKAETSNNGHAHVQSATA
ncbi:MAG TPA: hypothetical protein PKM43_14425 [Verrucomicrobiota bacterium]|nr:hypothetical protein [Verrucomicrobiota bacterium]HRZ36975.1 hypothetical protein [Candidatus Paceibacterota bacterium]HRZ56266.1 hypothetical protein [Candidatus Paceibacterota bacterium]